MFSIAESRERQKPGVGYRALKSLVSRLKPETRSAADLTVEEQTNLESYLRFKTSEPNERRSYLTPDSKIHRRGFIHLPALCGNAGVELDHSSMLGRFDEIEDIIVKGDRLWSVFTLRAKHVGPLYRQPATNKDLAIAEVCCLRYEGAKISEAWFFGDEFSICRQIGILVKVSPEPVTCTTVPTLAAQPTIDSDEIKRRQGIGVDYGTLKTLLGGETLKGRSDPCLTGEERENLDCYLNFINAGPSERHQFFTPDVKVHRRGVVHLPELRGTPNAEFDHASLDGLINEIEDVIVKRDRLWSVFTIRARHIGPLFGVPATHRTIEVLGFCVMRFEAGKIAEAWFLHDELGLCRQLGIPIVV